MKKGGFLRNVLDTIRSNPSSQQSGGGNGQSQGGSGRGEFGGQLKPNHFCVAQVSRHGFPEQPTALAYDPVQKIAAIGTKNGDLRVFGRPGVDVWVQHKPAHAVTHIKFIINQGAIITVTADESIHLWSLRGPNLKIQVSTSGQQHASGGLSPAAHSPSPGAGGSSTASSSAIHQQHTAQAQSGDSDYLSDALFSGTSASSTSIDHHKQIFKQPEVLHTLKFEREHITCLHQTLMSKWLYIGTERGNVHVANVETFELSGYSIAWNKAIELSRKTHPGSIIHISECPQDTNKLLIGYESGCIALWDLKSRSAEGRYYYAENLLWLAWHFEGKQFVAAHGDGSLVTWQLRSNAKPVRVMHPHAKSSQGEQSELSQPQHLASSFARSLNNELYRPINKVEWKTSKSNNEQFFLFSGGLPYDGLENDQEHQLSYGASNLNLQPLRQSADSTAQARLQASNQQYLKAASASPSGHLASPSPISPSISPSSAHDSGFKSASRQSALNQAQHHQQHWSKEKKCLRSTSLTVMFGKSITVLEMDETIIDFITVCDNSPYENDSSDPFAVLVLLSNDLILIDLTSSGYPSFDSPYPSGTLNESPVTCVQYLADCSSDLIPFLYSTSQNVISRVPKKGFSDKEWPINGGDWGQAMQSYPELVLTGHADGTIKFWDMSGVNFDLISKLKTAKLFDRPNKPSDNLVIVTHQNHYHQLQNKRISQQTSHNLTPKLNSPLPSETSCSFPFPSQPSALANQLARSEIELNSDQRYSSSNYFAIEQIEYCSITKHLIVAGALSQVIQFRLNKGASSTSNETTFVLVEPLQINQSQANVSNESTLQVQQQKLKQHLLLSAKSNEASTISGSSAASSVQRSRLSGFQPELICLTPLLMQNNSSDDVVYCHAPPKVTAISFQPTHNILAYSHEIGIVLIDIIQKCVIMNASLNDLYGGSSIMTTQRDIVNIQPFDTSSILQQHYQSGAAAASANLPGSSVGNNVSPASTFAKIKAHPSESNNNSTIDNSSKLTRSVGQPDDNGHGMNPLSASSLYKSSATNELDSVHSENTRQLDPVDSEPVATVGVEQQKEQEQRQASASVTREDDKNNEQHQQTRDALQLEYESPLPSPQIKSPARSKHQLTSAKSVAVPDYCSIQRSASIETSSKTDLHLEQEHQQMPVAPPRMKKRRSVPVNEFVASRKLQGQVTRLECIPSQLTGINLQSRQQQQQKQLQIETDGNECENAEIDRRFSSSGGETDMNEKQQQPSGGGGVGTISSLFTKLMDKIDSSFTRSRSSSCSSNAPNDHGSPQQQQQHQQLQLQQAADETIQCLCFLDWTSACQPASPVPQTAVAGATGNNKSLDSQASSATGQLALWLGTSQGCVLLVSLTMPDSEDNRVLQLQSIQADPIPQARIKLPGAILCLTTFNSVCSPPSTGSGGAASSHQHLTSQSSSQESEAPTGSSAQESSASSSSDLDRGSSVFLSIISEKQAKVFKVPSVQNQSSHKSPSDQHHHHHLLHHHAEKHSKQQQQQQQQPDLADSPMAKLLVDKTNCFAKLQLSDTSHACCADVIQMRQPDESCLAAYLATGHMTIHSLPQLRPLMETEFVPCTCALISKSMRLSRNGHGLYQPSAGEICKFTLSAQYKTLLHDMTGCLYVPREMPEMPRTNFFKSLFSVATSSAASRQSDRDELFGESSAGKASRSVAKHISSSGAQASSAMDKLKGVTVGSMGHEMRMAREGLDERGEKLGDIEDRTLQMMNQSENYAQAAHQLAQKFKDKKWYQF